MNLFDEQKFMFLAAKWEQAGTYDEFSDEEYEKAHDALWDFINQSIRDGQKAAVREALEKVRPSTQKDLVVNWNHDFKRGWIRRSEDIGKRIDTVLAEMEKS